jgi:hypothetical protein
MKLEMTILILALGATAAFAQTRFSVGVQVGGGSGYYTPPPQPVYGYQPYYQPDYGWNGSYYNGYQQDDQHWRHEEEEHEKGRQNAWREQEKRGDRDGRDFREHGRDYQREH